MSWSTQNVYDYVVNHLRTGNKTHGLYRDIDGNGNSCFCAKGCLSEIEELKLLSEGGLIGHSVNPFTDWAYTGAVPSTLTSEIMYLLDDLEWVWERTTILYSEALKDDNAVSWQTHPRKETVLRNSNLTNLTDEECFQLVARRYCLTYKPVDMKLPDNVLPSREVYSVVVTVDSK